jgi:hypothetical protein
VTEKVRCRLIGWHYERTIEMPRDSVSHTIMVPASKAECGIPTSYLDLDPDLELSKPAVLARRFVCNLNAVNAGWASTIRRAPGVTYWFEEAGRCVFTAEGVQVTCPCPTCKEGWTSPGKSLEEMRKDGLVR